MSLNFGTNPIQIIETMKLDMFHWHWSYYWCYTSRRLLDVDIQLIENMGFKKMFKNSLNRMIGFQYKIISVDEEQDLPASDVNWKWKICYYCVCVWGWFVY